MVRGKRKRHHGETGETGSQGPRRNEDNFGNPLEPEEDLLRDLRPVDEELPPPGEDEYLWPAAEEEEDD